MPEGYEYLCKVLDSLSQLPDIGLEIYSFYMRIWLAHKLFRDGGKWVKHASTDITLE